MKVVELMRTHIVTISPDATVADAVDIMDLYQLTSIPVVDSDGYPLGAIDDLAISEFVFGSSSLVQGGNPANPRANAAKMRKISELMRSPSEAVDQNADVELAANTMTSNGLMRIPVTTEGKVTGTLSRIDICQAILEGQIS